jgi:hypothetical protein
MRDSSINTMMHGVRGFFRFAHIDGLIAADPAVYARLPKIHADETRTQGLDRLELIRFLQVAQTITVHHGALGYLLGINALRASEAAAVRIDDYQETLRGPRPASGRQGQQTGHHAPDGAGTPGPGGMPRQTHLGAAHPPTDIWRTDRPPRRLPHGRAHREDSADSATRQPALPAPRRDHQRPRRGVPLRDAQILARHADPRTTQHYDRARGNLDRHGVHFLTAYFAGVPYISECCPALAGASMPPTVTHSESRWPLPYT